MQKKTRFALALTALTAALASCGPQNTPTPAPLVKVELSAPFAFGGQGQQGLGAQGLTADAPARHYDVTVRNSSGQVVAFTGTTYDPTGAGSKTLTLNAANNFKHTLLLPAGDYTFENKVKDDETGNTLLAYGPASENPGTVDKNGHLIRLKSHAVFNAANSSLAPSLTLNELYTDSTFNLSLNLKTNTVALAAGARAATVPTSDIGPVTYTLGNSTDGVLNGAGSKVGVNVTARGTDTDSELNVIASFSAWVYDASTDTASFQPVSVAFAKQIQTNVMTTDTVMPTLTMNAATANTGALLNLTGTVGDDIAVQNLRVYVDGNLVASSDPTEQTASVMPVTGDSTGNWTAPWMAGKDGTYAVVVIAEDSSGNETRAEQSVTATTPPAANYDFNAEYNWSTRLFNVTAGQVNTYRVNVDFSQGGYTFHVWAQSYGCGTTCNITISGIAPDGTVIPAVSAANLAQLGNFSQTGTYTLTMTTDFDGQVDFQAHID